MPREVTGICYICGVYGKLSKEHMPPQKAFNECTVFLRKIKKEQSGAVIRWKSEQRQGGNFEYVLCESCNNRTGHWYGSAYVNFAKICAEHAHPANAEKTVSFQAHGLFPLRILKEAFAIMCASSGPGLIQKNPVLRQLILDTGSRRVPSHLRLLPYLRCHGGGRSSGVAGILNTDTGKNCVVAEFSWWPVGWLLAFDDSTDVSGYDITSWCQYSYDEEKSPVLALPCHFAVTSYPMDYRNPEQVIRDRRRNERVSGDPS